MPVIETVSYDLHKLKASGNHWIRCFPDIGLVGDLEVSKEEIDALAVSLGRFASRAGWDEEVCAALTVVVVNLAYYSPDEIDEGFRWQVLHKLFGQPMQDVNFWQDQIGSPVLRLLKRHFYVEDIPGPFRYVRPIMLQAGVPARLSNAFATFFLGLSQRYGLQFSKGDYLKGCTEIPVQSSWLRSFLRTNGWEYSRDIARILHHLEKGILTQSHVSSLPQRFRLTVEQIRSMLAHSPSVAKTSDHLPLPKLVLDKNSLRLAIHFSEKGLDGKYRNIDGSKVRMSRYSLQEHDFSGALKGKIIYADGRSENWTIDPWRPKEHSWASFRTTDGSIETSSSDFNGRLVRPGRRLIAVPGVAYIPEEFIVEELGDLFVPGLQNVDIRILECDLPAEFELPEIGLKIGAPGSENFPELRFGDLVNQFPFSTNTFVGSLPQIFIEHWSPAIVEKYVLIHDDGLKTRAIPETLYSSKASFRLPLSLSNTSGRVFIEPKGRTPKGFWQNSLDYTLLPEGKLVWPSGLNGPSDVPVIEIQPAGKFTAEWQQTTIETDAQGRWRVPEKLDYVDGRLSFENRISFYVAGPVYRFAVQGSAIKEDIVWQNDLQERSSITLFLSDKECGQRIELGVADRRGFVKCIDLGPVPRNARLDLSTDSIRDAFETRSCCAGRIAVRGFNKSVVVSDVAFLNESLIAQRLFDDPDDEFSCWVECVPDQLRLLLEKTREMRIRPVSNYPLEDPPIPGQLLTLLRSYDICGRILDWNEKIDRIDELAEPLRVGLTWYSLAKSFVENETGVNPAEASRLITERPALSEIFPKSSPRQRWRRTLASILWALRDRKSLSDYRRLINEWSSNCRRRHWQAAFGSRIGRTTDGQMLTEAAKHYYHALNCRQDNQINKSKEYFARANNDIELLCQNSVDGLTWELAVALRFMIYFHIQHPQVERVRKESVEKLGNHWSKFRALVLGQSDVDSHFDPASIGLADFSPHELDIQLERELLV